MSYEEEDACMSYEYQEEENKCVRGGGYMHVI
jgi:hypothetical protein